MKDAHACVIRHWLILALVIPKFHLAARQSILSA